MKILLAEDNAIARTALAAGLSAEGYEVDLAGDGEEALRRARQQQPDFIISDVLMPKMDGYSLCQAIRGDAELYDIPVVFYSATFLDPEDEDLARSVGASGFIHKNVDPQSFQRQLRHVIEANKNRQPPTFRPDPVEKAEVTRQHNLTLIGKLNKKVEELEAEKQALRENQQLLEQIVTTVPDVVFMLSLPELEATYIAPEAERLTGYSGSDVIGNPDGWLWLIEEEDQARVLSEINAAVEQNSSVAVLSRMKHKEGGYRWVEARISPRFDDVGEPIELVGVLTDVTQRIEAEDRLRESERSLNTLLANLPGMAYRCRNTPDWNMVLVSAGAEELTGYKPKEIIHNSVISYGDLIHPEDELRVWEEVQQAISEGRQFSIAYRIRHKDGGIRWVWERGVGVEEDGSDEVWVEGFINDITQRKRAEEQLIESERRYRGLFEMMDAGMAIHELVQDSSGNPVDSRFIEVNHAFEKLSELTSEQVVGKRFSQIIPEAAKEWIKDYIDVSITGEPRRLLRYLKSRDRYFDEVVYKNADKQFVTLITDVTEQQKSEAIIQNLARFPKENPNPVLRISWGGTLLYANEAAEVLNAKWSLQQDRPVPEALLQQIREAERDDGLFSCQLGERWFSFLVRPVSEESYINIYGRDITEEHRAQNELIAMNRVLQTLSEGNRTLVHSKNERTLLENICQVFTQEGDYPAAWIAVPNRDATTLRCLAYDGPLKEAISDWGWKEVLLAEESHPMVTAFKSVQNLIISRGDDSAAQFGLDGAMAEISINTVFLLPIAYLDEIFGVIGIFSQLPVVMQEKERALLDELSSDLGYGIQSHRTKRAHEESVLRLNRAMLHTVEAVSIALEKRDPYTAGHQNRVASLSVAIAEEMGFSDERVEGIRLGSMVHDIGKISVPAEILNRPGKLSPDEFGVIKAHPEAGYDILKGVDFPWPITEMIIQHHERLDGSGYPAGLKGEQISEEARILAVADVVEAITSHRPYRPSLGLEIAMEEIQRGRGSIYDADVVDACLRLFREKGFEWEGL